MPSYPSQLCTVSDNHGKSKDCHSEGTSGCLQLLTPSFPAILSDTSRGCHPGSASMVGRCALLFLTGENQLYFATSCLLTSSFLSPRRTFLSPHTSPESGAQQEVFRSPEVWSQRRQYSSGIFSLLLPGLGGEQCAPPHLRPNCCSLQVLKGKRGCRFWTGTSRTVSQNKAVPSQTLKHRHGPHSALQVVSRFPCFWERFNFLKSGFSGADPATCSFCSDRLATGKLFALYSAQGGNIPHISSQ